MKRTALALVLGLGFGVACSVNLGDDLVYSCTKDSDCAGDGFKCAAPPGGAGFCCRVTGREVCDGKDNDCNGVIDDVQGPELCNGVDDNCNGQVDEGFDLTSDDQNCGRCGFACPAGQHCSAGSCTQRAESSCSDGIDNDQNGLTDCADPSCNQQLCGQGCQCRAGVKAEGNCHDGVDNDGDGKIDCADEDCAGAGCGDGGCVCAGGGETETDCRDGLDNDSDTLVDCADPDCVGHLCEAGPSTRTCAAGGACLCNGGAPVPETGALCRDGVDNDCDGLVDCQEADCNLTSCNPDGGAGCVCVGGHPTETDCADRIDNDGDGTTDCADKADCPESTACTFLDGSGVVTNGTCGADGVCR